MREAAARRTGDQAPGTHGRLGFADHDGSVALEHDEQLLLSGVAVAWIAAASRRERDLPEARCLRARSPPEVARPDAAARPLEHLLGRVGERDDEARTWRRSLGHRQRAAFLPLLFERMTTCDGVRDPGGARPHHACARQVAELGVEPLPEREHVEPRGTRDDGVRAGSRQVDDRVTLADLERLAVHPADARAREHVEDLLLSTVLVRRRRAHAGLDAKPPQPHAHRPGGRAEIAPGGTDLAEPARRRGDVIPVHDVRLRHRP